MTEQRPLTPEEAQAREARFKKLQEDDWDSPGYNDFWYGGLYSAGMGSGGGFFSERSLEPQQFPPYHFEPEQDTNEAENNWLLCSPGQMDVPFLLRNWDYMSPTSAPATDRTLVFAEGLMDPVVSGEKQITLRQYRPEAHDFKKGDLFVGTFRDGLDIALKAKKDTKVKPFSALTDREVREDGFRDARDAFEGMGRYYSDLNPDSELAVVRFKIATARGLAAVRINEHGKGKDRYA